MEMSIFLASPEKSLGNWPPWDTVSPSLQLGLHVVKCNTRHFSQTFESSSTGTASAFTYTFLENSRFNYNLTDASQGQYMYEYTQNQK